MYFNLSLIRNHDLQMLTKTIQLKQFFFAVFHFINSQAENEEA